VAGRAESARFTREHKKPVFPTAGAADPSKPAAGVAAVGITLHDLLDDQPKKAILPLETVPVLGEKPVEMMEQHPVEDGPLRMSGTIDSRHGGRKASRNGPKSCIRPRLLEKTGRAPARKGESARENVNSRCRPARRMKTAGNYCAFRGNHDYIARE